MAKRRTAEAGKEVVAEAEVFGSKDGLPRMRVTEGSPRTGNTFTARAQNGITYSGTVSSTEKVAGKTVVTFTDGLRVASPE